MRLLFAITDDRGREVDARRVGAGLPAKFKLSVGWFVVWLLVMVGMIAWRSLTRGAGATRAAAGAGGVGGAWGLQPHHVMLIVPAAMALMSLVRGVRTARETRAITLTREGRCGACGYDLSHATPEADGCRVCPECGAAWRMRVR